MFRLGSYPTRQFWRLGQHRHGEIDLMLRLPFNRTFHANSVFKLHVNALTTYVAVRFMVALADVARIARARDLFAASTAVRIIFRPVHCLPSASSVFNASLYF